MRSYLEDWVGSYEQQRFSRWEGEHLGGGVVLVTATLDARMRTRGLLERSASRALRAGLQKTTRGD